MSVLEAADRWRDRPPGLRPEVQLMERARLLASDTAVVNPGGGSFSVKAPVAGPWRGAGPDEVMWVSGWGCDGAALRREELACLRVADIRAARGQPMLTTESMINYLAGCAVSGDQPYPALETLLHGYLEHAHVDHTHPEAIIALTATPRGRELAAEAFGDEAIWRDYVQFSPAVAADLAAEIAARPAARFVLLAHHGLLTWADSSEQCYKNTIEAVAVAGRALDTAAVRQADLGGTLYPLQDREFIEDYFADVLPALRGWLSAAGQPKVLLIDQDRSAGEFASSVRGPRLSTTGPAGPDSLVKTKRKPAVAKRVLHGSPAARRAAVARAIGRYGGERRPVDADLPRVIIIRGIGVVSAGEDERTALLAEAHFRQTRRVIAAADAAGGYRSLSDQQSSAEEYWPLTRDKPQLGTSPGGLGGRIVLLLPGTGELASLAEPLILLLLSEGAHVIVGGAAASPEPRLRYSPAGCPVRAAVLAFGGLDLVVDLDPASRLALRLTDPITEVLAQQGWPGHYLAVTGRSAAAAAILDRMRGSARGWLVPHSVVVPEGASVAGQADAVARRVTMLSASVPAGLARGLTVAHQADLRLSGR